MSGGWHLMDEWMDEWMTNGEGREVKGWAVKGGWGRVGGFKG